jgi:hypothetical protein
MHAPFVPVSDVTCRAMTSRKEWERDGIEMPHPANGDEQGPRGRPPRSDGFGADVVLARPDLSRTEDEIFTRSSRVATGPCAHVGLVGHRPPVACQTKMPPMTARPFLSFVGDLDRVSSGTREVVSDVWRQARLLATRMQVRQARKTLR